MKIERFITEYASHKRRFIGSCDMMQPEIKTSALAKIEKALYQRERGFISADEAMMLIHNCCD